VVAPQEVPLVPIDVAPLLPEQLALVL
jgi:hypothetical protein